MWSFTRETSIICLLMGSFKAYNLSSELVNALNKLGYKEPSKVQEQVIPKALIGKSLLAQSATGSGKTHAYLIPLLAKLDLNLSRLQDIIICPTRELARQTYDFARAFTRFFPKLKVRLFTSETSSSENLEGLSSAPHIVIGTPGRIHEILVKEHALSLQSVRTVVLDEADMLLDLGYFEDIVELFSILKEPQILVFSATLKENLKNELARFVGSDFEYKSENTNTASSVRHHLVDNKHQNDGEALLSLLNIIKPYLCIVFASTKEKVGEIHRYLSSQGKEAIYFTGDLDERSRKKALRAIRENEVPLIVSSDLLSRGMDIEDVSDVISIDLPNDLEFYHHRAGRTGRFGKEGDSWVFYNDDTTALPLALIEEGVKFDFYSLRNGELKKDPVGLLPKNKLRKKKAFLNEEEATEIKITKARHRKNEVKPGYKKKEKYAIEKVKRKYRRKAIQKSVRKELTKKFKAEAKKGRGEE